MAHEEGDTPEDVFLEDLRSERSLRWVTEENARALSAVAGPGGDVESDPLFSKLRAIYDDKKKIPNVRLRGTFVYNFWQDDVHVKGIWRRTSMADFKTDEPTWETVLDVDALAKSEQKSWVWKGPSFLDYGPGDDEHRVDRCVVKLSDEGRDACEVREFDVVTKGSWEMWVTKRTTVLNAKNPSSCRAANPTFAGSIATRCGSGTTSGRVLCHRPGTR